MMWTLWMVTDQRMPSFRPFCFFLRDLLIFLSYMQGAYREVLVVSYNLNLFSPLSNQFCFGLVLRILCECKYHCGHYPFEKVRMDDYCKEEKKFEDWKVGHLLWIMVNTFYWLVGMVYTQEKYSWARNNAFQIYPLCPSRDVLEFLWAHLTISAPNWEKKLLKILMVS